MKNYRLRTDVIKIIFGFLFLFPSFHHQDCSPNVSSAFFNVESTPKILVSVREDLPTARQARTEAKSSKYAPLGVVEEVKNIEFSFSEWTHYLVFERKLFKIISNAFGILAILSFFSKRKISCLARRRASKIIHFIKLDCAYRPSVHIHTLNLCLFLHLVCYMFDFRVKI